MLHTDDLRMRGTALEACLLSSGGCCTAELDDRSELCSVHLDASVCCG